MADGYLALQRSAKQDQTRSAGTWLAGEIDRLRAKVAELESKVEQYRSRTNLFVGNNNTMLSNQQLGDINAQLAAARGQKANAEVKAKLIREALRTGGPIEFSDIINSELMRRLSEQRVTLLAQLAEQSATLLGQHPRIKELRAQIADLERQMRTEADRLARSLENDAKLSSGSVEQLSSGLTELKRQAASTNEQDVQLRALERDAKSQRDLLESYLAKYREASARDSIGAASPDARIISTALVSSTPAWPRKVPTVLVSALAMFVLSAGFVLTGALLGGAPAHVRRFAAGGGFQSCRAGRIASHRRPGQRGGAPQLTASPAPGFHASALDHDVRGTAVPRETVEALARDLAAAGEEARRLTVVGAQRDVGTTMAAITLARSLSRHARVVLIDLALGAPNLSVIASDTAAPGIAELVNGSASFAEILTRDRYSGAHVIMAGRHPIDAPAVLSGPRFSITLEALSRSYDFVVVDAGTVARFGARSLRCTGSAGRAGGGRYRRPGHRVGARARAARRLR